MPSSKDVLKRRDTTVRYLRGTDIPIDRARAEAMRKYLASFTTGTRTSSLFEGEDPVYRRNMSYDLIETIVKKSTTVAAIVRRTVDDVMSPGWTFVPAPGVKNPKPRQREIALRRFRHPSIDDISNEWLEGLIYDLCVFSDCYLELSGAGDRIVGETDSKSGNEVPVWGFGGPLQSWYHIPATTMWLAFNEHGETNDPPEPSYYHSILDPSFRGARRGRTVAGISSRGRSIYFTRDKIVHTGKFKDGVYGTPALLPLITVLAAQFNLIDYVGKLHAGEVPKALMNAGDMDDSEIKSLIRLIKQQIDTASNPFGIVAINVPENFTLERLMDTAQEGRFIELLDFYREEICAVLGIHPSKMGWGELRGGEDMAMDTWYDVVESHHHKAEAMINNGILPLIGVTDWVFKFNSPRPRKEEHESRNRAMASQAIMLLRKANVITVNEARTDFLGLEKLEGEDWADDAAYVPPQPSPFGGGTPGQPGMPPTEGPEPARTPEGPKPPQRPPMEPGGGTSQRPPPPPKKEIIVTFEKGKPPDYVVERIPDTVGDKEVIRLIPYNDFIENNEIYVMGVDANNSDESGDN